MQTVHRGSRGQVLIIFVFAIIGLIGITGLAIDGGNILADRRHAQNAADAAALAAALTRVKQERAGANQSDCISISGGGPCGLAILRAAQNSVSGNGYDWGDLAHVQMDVHTPPLSGTYTQPGDPNEYVEVILTTHVETWFAKILGRSQFDNTVRGVALALYEPTDFLYGGNSLVVLRPHSGAGNCGSGGGGGGGGDAYLGGSAGLILHGGGLFVNSDNSSCALKIRDSGDPACASIQLLEYPPGSGAKAGITGLGGEDSTCVPKLMKHVSKPYPYPPLTSPVAPIPPTACSKPINTSPGTWNPVDSTFHFAPGHYVSLPPDKDTTLDPGVFCVDNLIKTTNSYRFFANGAFMYVRPGGNFSFNGGTIQLAAPGFALPGKPAEPVSAEALPYKGYLIYVNSNVWTDPALDCNINAASDTYLKGVIYAPHCDVTINGNSGTVGLTAQVVSYTLNLTGGAILDFTYDKSVMPQVPELNWTGLFH